MSYHVRRFYRPPEPASGLVEPCLVLSQDRLEPLLACLAMGSQLFDTMGRCYNLQVYGHDAS
jgi:hypothetical protein